jgi:tetratricopeptide (TPR) repeat protein
MGKNALSIEATEDGLRRAEVLLSQKPGDPELVQYAAVFHLDLARMRQQSGDLTRGAEELASGIALLEKLSVARPNESETLSNIASSHARMGAIQAELGRRGEALKSYRAGMSVLENLTRRFPNDVHARHELMLAYSHVGDTLGNPSYDNFGDETGARDAYAKMVEAARSLHEADSADVRAMSDYGIALLRLGLLSPPDQKMMILKKSYELLQHAAVRNPTDKPTRTHKAWLEVALGDASLAGGDHASSAHYYQMAVTTSEEGTLMDAGDQRRFVEAARKLAQEQVRSGDRSRALQTLEKAVQLAQRLEAQTSLTSVTQRSVIASAWQAQGAIYAMLANVDRGQEQERDRQVARQAYEHSVSEWRKLEKLQGFTALRRREMESTVAEFVSLDVSGR